MFSLDFCVTKDIKFPDYDQNYVRISRPLLNKSFTTKNVMKVMKKKVMKRPNKTTVLQVHITNRRNCTKLYKLIV